MNLLKVAETEFFRSKTKRQHPFRFFTMATTGEYPEIRTVVKRDFTADWSLLFYTDARTPKVRQIAKNDKVSALFYHSKKQLQVRIKGIAKPIDKTSKEFSKLLSQIKNSRSAADYLTTNAPGTPILEESTVVYGDDFHFLPIQIQAVEIDVLQLSREGHQRQLFKKVDGEWLKTNLVP
ncbi:MAG: pyridoxamine 5'-phosphate oxidase [Paraglaciecola sp.]|jgi:pyridoxamine 5'-phosphate oxidase